MDTKSTTSATIENGEILEVQREEQRELRPIYLIVYEQCYTGLVIYELEGGDARVKGGGVR